MKARRITCLAALLLIYQQSDGFAIVNPWTTRASAVKHSQRLQHPTPPLQSCRHRSTPFFMVAMDSPKPLRLRKKMTYKAKGNKGAAAISAVPTNLAKPLPPPVAASPMYMSSSVLGTSPPLPPPPPPPPPSAVKGDDTTAVEPAEKQLNDKKGRMKKKEKKFKVGNKAALPTKAVASPPPPPPPRPVKAKEGKKEQPTAPVAKSVSLPPPPPTPAALPINEPIVDEKKEEAPPSASSTLQEEEETKEETAAAAAEKMLEAEQEVIDLDSDFTRRVRDETDKVSMRSKRMTALTGSIQRAISRKEEMEEMLKEEIDGLKQKLEIELESELQRKEEVKELLSEFDAVIIEKRDLITTEQDVLYQMEAVKGQVKETQIRTQVADAMSKKADLISIEVILLEDMVECRERILWVVDSVDKRIAGLRKAAVLNEDKNGNPLKDYNWDDVKTLQEVLLSSVEGMVACDEMVAGLRIKLEDAGRQKEVVLGIRPAPATMEADEVIVGGNAGSAIRRFNEIQQKASSMDSGTLLKTAGSSAKDTAESVTKAVTVSVSSFTNYLKSPSAQQVASSFIDLFASAKEHFRSLAGTVEVAVDEWEKNTLRGEEITTVDLLVINARDGIAKVATSERLKESLGKATKLGGQVPAAVKEIGTLSVEAVKGATSNDELSDAITRALASISTLIVSLATLGGQVAATQFGTKNLLPAAKEDDTVVEVTADKN